MQLSTGAELCTSHNYKAGSDFTIFADQIRIHNPRLSQERVQNVMKDSALSVTGGEIDTHIKEVHYTDEARKSVSLKDYRTCDAIQTAYKARLAPSIQEREYAMKVYKEQNTY